MDMDYARRLARREADGQEMPVAELTPLRYGPVEQRLDDVVHAVLLVRAAVQLGYARDGKEPRVTPPRRPRTALDIAREELEFEELDRITAEVLGLVPPEG